MDWVKIITEVVIGIATAVPILWKMKDNRNKEIAERKQLADHLLEKESKEKELQAKMKEKSSVEFIFNINRLIAHETKKIRDRHSAMRCYVIQFSNGTVTETKLHLLKITFLHEVVVDWTDRRIEALSKFFKEAHLPEMFQSPLSSVIRQGQYYLKNIEDLDIKDVHHRDYKYWLMAYGVKSTLWLPIHTKEGKVAAVLVSHWPVTTDWDGTVIAKIKDVNRTIESIYEQYKLYEE